MCVCVLVSQVELVPGEAVCEELCGSVVLWGHFGLERLLQLPPHAAHAAAERTFLFNFIALWDTEVYQTKKKMTPLTIP